MPDKLKLAVVGAGVFGSIHLEACASHAGAELAAVCETNPERAARVREKYGVRVFERASELAAVRDIKAVTVATPDFAHADIVCAMLEAGKHVLVEKPLSTSVEEARRMVRTARTARRFLMVDFHNRWNPPFVEARARIEQGDLGQPFMASARLANTLYVPLEMLAWAGRSGPHWFLFPHIVDLVCWLFGQEARRVMGWARKGVLTAKGVDAYDAVQAMLMFDSASALLETAWVLPESHPTLVDFQVTLLGTRGRMAFHPLGPVIEVSGPKTFSQPPVGGAQSMYGRTEGWQLSPIRHFIDSVLADTEPMCTPEEGFHNTAVICAVEESIRTGAPADVATFS
ncbi:MAG: Gfo/Idh/MocA family oxidoreductase [Kiritimatiellaeota bacterium]|nr:Gfo/Idh/MocA family oxidoreductase [Kiritimatiellota bacterium]